MGSSLSTEEATVPSATTSPASHTSSISPTCSTSPAPPRSSTSESFQTSSTPISGAQRSRNSTVHDFSGVRDWRSRQWPVQLFGVVRHAERADELGTTCQGKPWLEGEDFEKHPRDPPLSDKGFEGTQDIADYISSFMAAYAGAEIHVIVTSPYMRCVQTAVKMCQLLPGRPRLMVDQGLSEVYGPEVFGDKEPSGTSRPYKEILEYVRRHNVVCTQQIVGTHPCWPESTTCARKRYSERVLAYLRRAVRSHRNFLIVSHGECVQASMAVMPSMGGRTVESVGYGGTMLAARIPSLPKWREASSFDSEALDEGTRAPPRSNPRCLMKPSTSAWAEEDLGPQSSWTLDTWNVQVGHTWRDGATSAMNMAMAALKMSEGRVVRQAEVESLLGLKLSTLLKESEGMESEGDLESAEDSSTRACGLERRISCDLASEVSVEAFLFGFSRCTSPISRCTTPAYPDSSAFPVISEIRERHCLGGGKEFALATSPMPTSPAQWTEQSTPPLAKEVGMSQLMRRRAMTKSVAVAVAL